jgi:hypothetical protein
MAASVPFYELYPFILPFASGAAEPLVDQFILNTLIDFYGKTLFVQQQIGPYNAVAGASSIPVTLPTGFSVALLRQAWYLNQKLDIATVDTANFRTEQLNNAFTGADTQSATPKTIFQTDPNTFQVDYPPAVASTAAFTFWVALKPNRSCTLFDQIIFDEFAEVIAAGVLSSLLMVPRQEFTETKIAMLKKGEYERGLLLAQIRANKMYARLSDQVVIPLV